MEIGKEEVVPQVASCSVHLWEKEHGRLHGSYGPPEFTPASISANSAFKRCSGYYEQL